MMNRLDAEDADIFFDSSAQYSPTPKIDSSDDDSDETDESDSNSDEDSNDDKQL